MAPLNQKEKRLQELKEASHQTWDFIIIGGGITGAGIYRQASLDGYKVLLLEKEDFASGTSWCSSKLIHGGLRYLEQMHFSLVFESIQEKNHLLKFAPHLVKPLPFLFPVFKGDRKPRWMIYLGTIIYAVMAKFSNFPRLISRNNISQHCPDIRKDQLKGAVLYQDAQTVDASLALSSIKSADSDCAKAFNHCRVEAFIQNDDTVKGVTVADGITKTKHEFLSKWVIDATGPWKLGPYKDQALITYSKGSHLIIQGNPYNLTSAVTMFSPDDGRVMFCIPWLGQTLVGTTDTPTEESPDFVRITDKEQSYILKTLQHYFPSTNTQDIQILSRFAGLRTLVRDPQKSLTELSRDHLIESPTNGLVQVYGGKLTSFIKIGLDVVKFIEKQMGHKKSKRHCKKLAEVKPIDPESLTEEDVQSIIETEFACTVSDILIRRTLANLLTKDHGESLIPLVQRVLAQNFDYTQDELMQQAQNFKEQSQQW